MRAHLPPGMETGRAHWAGARGSSAQALTVPWPQHGSRGTSTEEALGQRRTGTPSPSGQSVCGWRAVPQPEPPASSGLAP